MKKQLYIYSVLVVAFIVYNQFFQVRDERMNHLINILFASFLFLYIGYLAYLVLQNLKKKDQDWLLYLKSATTHILRRFEDLNFYLLHLIS